MESIKYSIWNGIGKLCWGVQMATWAVGYFFGFSLTSIFTQGLLVPEEFSKIWRYEHRFRRVIFRQSGNYYLAVHWVSCLGWLLLLSVVWLLSLMG